MSTSFMDLRGVHADLGEVFAAFQYALLDQELDRAEGLLKRFRKDLLAHMRLEEEVLIPIYAEGPIQPAGKVVYFESEHRKLLEMLDGLKEGLEAARAAPKEEFHPALLAVVDASCHYTHFTEHHEMREERYLFPGLDERVGDEEERRALMAGGKPAGA